MTMNFIKRIERLGKIDKLIRIKRTGTPNEFAEKLGISKRQLYNYLDEIKTYGLEIKYSRNMRSFFYSNHKRLHIRFDLEVLDERQIRGKEGGFVSVSPRPGYFQAARQLNRDF
ncbi:MAG: helix-turn-helix protein [Anaerophaga sp.]|nr:helix-turn-helix protein [Anaerophaga sp.]